MELIFSGDPHTMNWLRADYPYAEVRRRQPALGADVTAGIATHVETTRDGDLIHTTVIIENRGAKPYFSDVGDIGITLPLEDRYDGAEAQQTERCNVHVFCGGSSSFVLGLRMGGEAPHLGLVLTEGSLTSYSIERNTELHSNDRGCFILHPTPFVLQPGEQTRIAWSIFPCLGKEDFFAEAGRHTRFLRAEWSSYVLHEGESSELVLTPSFHADRVCIDGEPVARDETGRFRWTLVAATPGEREIVISADEQTVRTRILVKPRLDALIERRSDFIVSKQQYAGAIEPLRGAYLVYDNEAEGIYYNQLNDYNAGRERVGMGVFIADAIEAVKSGRVRFEDPDLIERMLSSLGLFADYVRRELVDERTGRAFNDFGRDDGYRRLYNAPWYATFFLSLYRLNSEERDLVAACRIVRGFYDDGGVDHYPIELPITDLATALEAAGMVEELSAVRALFIAHADRITRRGSDFPRHEVNYEQSIVAPAVDILLQAHELAPERGYLATARVLVHILDQFHGVQPDYHLHEVGIRHWDAFWFGKRRTYGDTFPHYWSGLTGNVFARFAATTRQPEYARRARAVRRGVLPLIFDDGRASCAYVFPHAVNGQVAEYFDPYANDQDWGLVFAIRALREPPILSAS